MSEEAKIFFEILISFFTVVGFVYLCTEIIALFKYSKDRVNIPVAINSQDYSYQQIFFIVKAFSETMNNKSAEYLFDKITIYTPADEISELSDFLGKYESFADIRKK
ncbi:MAG: hypothetical protein IJO74_06810 [Clostridia bacterium]|nr:hypothetical protein [Clostridia bacterium]